MTVQAQNSVQYYNGPIEIGTELSIVEFTFIDNSHVSAKVRGNTEVWQYGYDYTVSGAQTLIRTITVQRRVAENEVLAVYLDVPITQNISPEEGGNFPASTNEYVLDKLTHISQMLDERVKRSLQISIDTPFSGTLPAPEPNKALKISSDGNSFVMSDYDPDTALVLTEQYRSEAQQSAAAAIASQNAAKASENNAAASATTATQKANQVESIYEEAVPELNSIIINGVTTLSNASNALRTTQITNCLLEVPQNIKLELVDGVLTLKAGSKVIVPNGAGVFEEKTVISDVTTPGTLGVGEYFIFDNSDVSGQSLRQCLVSNVFSGDTAPTEFNGGATWYNTADNIVRTYYNNAWIGNRSLPIAKVTVTTDDIRIDQIFNGMGYIGSTVFVLPNVKGLIPNGINEDGTLKNIEFTTTKVTINTIDANWVSQDWFIDGNDSLQWYPLQHGQIVYNEETNTWINSWQGGINFWFPVGKTYSTGGKITSFEPKQPVRLTKDDEFKELEKVVLKTNQITNCITEIPQRIKLELNNGILILKAGSEVIIPNGFEADGTTQKFDYVTIESDLSATVTAEWATGKHLICYNKTDNALFLRISHASGTLPSGEYTLYYNTSTNAVRDTHATDRELSLPIGFATVESLAFTSIDQVFNGFGYIGKCIWADKGVKALIPDGRNEDGTLKNIETITTKLVIRDESPYTSVNCFFDGTNILSYGSLNYFEQDTQPTSFGIGNSYAVWFNTRENKIYHTSDTGATWTSMYRVYLGTLTKPTVESTFTSMNILNTFRAVNYSNKSIISGWSMPSDKYIDLPPGASGAQFTAPANGFVFCLRNSTQTTGTIILQNLTTGIGTGVPNIPNGNNAYCYLPVRKGDVFQWRSDTSGTFLMFRFYYAEGEK